LSRFLNLTDFPFGRITIFLVLNGLSEFVNSKFLTRGRIYEIDVSEEIIFVSFKFFTEQQHFEENINKQAHPVIPAVILINPSENALRSFNLLLVTKLVKFLDFALSINNSPSKI
jgi:hypothetical protein